MHLFGQFASHVDLWRTFEVCPRGTWQLRESIVGSSRSHSLLFEMRGASADTALHRFSRSSTVACADLRTRCALRIPPACASLVALWKCAQTFITVRRLEYPADPCRCLSTARRSHFSCRTEDRYALGKRRSLVILCACSKNPSHGAAHDSNSAHFETRSLLVQRFAVHRRGISEKSCNNRPHRNTSEADVSTRGVQFHERRACGGSKLHGRLRIYHVILKQNNDEKLCMDPGSDLL